MDEASSQVPTTPKLRVFVSWRMQELAHERAALKAALAGASLGSFVFEDDAGARSQGIRDTYLDEIESAGLYLGIFWRGYGAYTIEEFEHAQAPGSRAPDAGGSPTTAARSWVRRCTCASTTSRTSTPPSCTELLREIQGSHSKRIYALAGQTRIHLDRVEGLGDFIEVEVVLREGQSDDEGRAIAERWMCDLGVADAPRVACAYVDLTGHD